MSGYPDVIMDHYRHPRNHKFRAHVSYNAASGLDNPSCGDEIQVKILIADGVVMEIDFEGIGCALSTASASLMTTVAKGKKIDEIMALSKDHVLEQLDIEISPVRLKCALLPLEAIQKAVKIF